MLLQPVAGGGQGGGGAATAGSSGTVPAAIAFLGLFYVTGLAGAALGNSSPFAFGQILAAKIGRR